MPNRNIHSWTVAEQHPGELAVPLFMCGDRSEAIEIVHELRERGRGVIAVETDDANAVQSSARI
jgi:hypothetical protein